MVQPPLCKVCGAAHWGVSHDFGAVKPVTPTVTQPVTKAVTRPDVTPDRNAARVRELEAEVERLTTEIKQLKRRLAEQGTKSVAASAAERMRRMRAKRKSASPN